MTVELRPVKVATIEGSEGRLVFLDEKLVAVLTRLSDIHGELQGYWFVEAGFGRLGDVHRTFLDLENARTWIRAQLDQELGSNGMSRVG